MSTIPGACESSERIPPVARWLSIDDLSLAARRDSERHGLQFCYDLLNSGALNHAKDHAGALHGSTCTVDTTRIAIGGYSVLFHLLFDGTDQCWILRIRLPRLGESLSPQQQLAESLLLESEISTMLYVRAKSNIPVPDVYGYDTSFSNPLGHPYMFIERVLGIAAICATMSCTPNQRRRLIRDMARIVHELGTLTFPEIGQLRFATTSLDKISVGKLVTRPGHIIGPFRTSTEYYRSRTSLLRDQLEREDNNQTTAMRFTTSDDSKRHPDQRAVHLGIHAGTLLQEWSIVDKSAGGPFPLKHPDLSFQNVLVND